MEQDIIIMNNDTIHDSEVYGMWQWFHISNIVVNELKVVNVNIHALLNNHT